jgi:hypothetical protein
MIHKTLNELSSVVPADEPPRQTSVEPEAETGIAERTSEPNVAAAATEAASTAPAERRRRARARRRVSAQEQPDVGAEPRGRRPRRSQSAGAAHRFVVQFRAQALVEAHDVEDALRQAASLGATDVLAITREA